ncbi:MAG TPA: DUF72 domain-containing protein [Candidatus Saccharimonadales bacterium]|nr:DUF72 domain-containing protein [Candidatus Saccharimonadales bacterium]
MKKSSLTSTKYLIGTSGWIYKDWAKRFYPPKMQNTEKLSFYAEHFPTVEINNSFYRLPSEKAFENWRKLTPDGFKFAVKLSRFLTHIKRLKTDDQTNHGIDLFCSRARFLESKFAVVLVQLPASFPASEEKVVNLIMQFKKAENRYGQAFPIALECRHASWITDKIFALLSSLNIAFVINSAPDIWPTDCRVTADFAYLRWHGAKRLYADSYSDKELSKWASFIKNNTGDCKAVYGYFNNDKSAKAVENAQFLAKKLAS